MDMTPNLENLSRELKKTGLKVQIMNDFVLCLYTPEKTKIGLTDAGLEIRFNHNLFIFDKSEKGFKIRFK